MRDLFPRQYEIGAPKQITHGISLRLSKSIPPLKTCKIASTKATNQPHPIAPGSVLDLEPHAKEEQHRLSEELPRTLAKQVHSKLQLHLYVR